MPFVKRNYLTESTRPPLSFTQTVYTTLKFEKMCTVMANRRSASQEQRKILSYRSQHSHAIIINMQMCVEQNALLILYVYVIMFHSYAVLCYAVLCHGVRGVYSHYGFISTTTSSSSSTIRLSSFHYTESTLYYLESLHLYDYIYFMLATE